MIPLKGLKEKRFGGKAGSGVYQTIINHIPPHTVYVEPFLGKGEVLRRKKPARSCSIGIDIDKSLMKVWYRNRKAMEKILPNFLPINRDFFEWQEETSTEKWFSFLPSSFLLNPREIVIYFDPPYPIGARQDKKTKLYKNELTDQQHELLLNRIQKLPFNVLITTYPNKLYKKYLTKAHGWNYTDYKAQTRTGAVTERLYYNYPKPVILHDYSFVGRNFRERERIKNKINRRVASLIRLRKKNPVEFFAVMDAMKTKISQHHN